MVATAVTFDDIARVLCMNNGSMTAGEIALATKSLKRPVNAILYDRRYTPKLWHRDLSHGGTCPRWIATATLATPSKEMGRSQEMKVGSRSKKMMKKMGKKTYIKEKRLESTKMSKRIQWPQPDHWHVGQTVSIILRVGYSSDPTKHHSDHFRLGSGIVVRGIDEDTHHGVSDPVCGYVRLTSVDVEQKAKFNETFANDKYRQCAPIFDLLVASLTPSSSRPLPPVGFFDFHHCNVDVFLSSSVRIDAPGSDIPPNTYYYHD